ncbi:hypothetical protein FTO70_03035 [Methanosarcina sp. KYL-1]|uniref:hypothetical protein n=1 Tax=Methanosarcina sp. KYL-1 TaxID=2602068 RepID=UPI0021019ABD|nr:hypothetical protein [Methanosarcina sp. KYL-1]MCQ1534681.1 hypothetical protein [Methanosarcina sp. KYL-1]
MKKTREVKPKNISIGKNASQDASGVVSDAYPFVSAPFSVCVPNPGLSFCREQHIKALIRQGSEAVYRLIEDVNLDGNYYRVKCVHLGGWEYCWDLAVRFQFFGAVQGLAVEPKHFVSGIKKRIVYRSLVLVNPYELWNEELVCRFANLQERLEFLIAQILFHECIHVLVHLGKTFPQGLGNTDIFLEFREVLQLANSEVLASRRQVVLACLYRLAGFASPAASPGSKLKAAVELYEFLIHEKYCIEKTDLGFGLPWSNAKIARDYSHMASLKVGPCPIPDTKARNRELLKLRETLTELYNELDRHMLLE